MEYCKACNSKIDNQVMNCQNCGIRYNVAGRNVFGKLILYSFIVYNFLMLILFILKFDEFTTMINSLFGKTHPDGSKIAIGLGEIMILFTCVMGNIVLGMMALLTRPEK